MGLHQIAALVLGIMALFHWLIYPRLSARLTYDSLQIMAVIFFVGAVILWMLPTT